MGFEMVEPLLGMPLVSGNAHYDMGSSTHGKSSPASCARGLQDSQGHVKGVFYDPLGIQDSNVVELLAIYNALKLFAFTSSVGSYKLIVEIDSKVVISWVLEGVQRPWNAWRTFNAINRLCATIACIRFIHTSFREATTMAVVMKFGMDGEEMFYAWWIAFDVLIALTHVYVLVVSNNGSLFRHYF
ncbi:Uncharacterized protein TCM_025355 [Theobroma cacao]|uniref:RNase H type-1 domain-containing protein n=1 Tax=Theobroma cacao TaxID=3641 RepID=A0A061EYV9_THECC|nr:Uncharacterized protein TCM_025355 [Theobroma cacao]